MHHGSPQFHRKMKLLRRAVDAGKPAFLVNSVWQSNPPDYDDVLRQLSSISVRENHSRDDLWERHGVNARVLPDISMFARLPCFSFRQNFRSQPALTDFYFAKGERFGQALELFPDAEYLKFDKMSWGRAIASIRTASYLITGRQHGVYAACRARVPFAASEGNTHKIRGLIASRRSRYTCCRSSVGDQRYHPPAAKPKRRASPSYSIGWNGRTIRQRFLRPRSHNKPPARVSGGG